MGDTSVFLCCSLLFNGNIWIYITHPVYQALFYKQCCLVREHPQFRNVGLIWNFFHTGGGSWGIEKFWGTGSDPAWNFGGKLNVRTKLFEETSLFSTIFKTQPCLNGNLGIWRFHRMLPQAKTLIFQKWLFFNLFKSYSNINMQGWQIGGFSKGGGISSRRECYQPDNLV